MSIPSWVVTLNFLATAVAACLCVWLWYLGRRHAFYRRAALILGANIPISLSSGIIISSASHDSVWLRVMIAGQLLQVAAFVCLGTSVERTTGKSAKVWIVLAFTGIGLALLPSKLIIQSSLLEVEVSHLTLGPLGSVFIGMILLGMVAGLAQVEALLRMLSEPVRYQAKYVLIGLGGIAGFQIYFQTQLLLLPVWETDLFLAGGMVFLLSFGLIAIGLTRRGIQEERERFYVSPSAVLGSFTVVFVGVYLIAVASVAGWLNSIGREIGPVIGMVSVFCGLLWLVVLLSSRAVRGIIRTAITRHLYRSKYDYRLKWLEATETFRGADSVDAILDRLRDLLGKTFPAPRISVWFLYEADRKFHQVRSIGTEAGPHPIDMSDPLVQHLERTQDSCLCEGQPLLSQLGFEGGLVVPIRSGGRLLAITVLGRGNGVTSYGTDDCDLLRAVANHVGLLLANAQLAEERATAVELHALHRYSAFCLHDLKNLAGKLSLVAQNAQVHGSSPAFQRSAMRAVSSTVEQMTQLITKLSLKPVQSQNQSLVDVNGVLQEIVEQIKDESRLPIILSLESVPRVVAAREQLSQVLLNIILNARQACGQGDVISVASSVASGLVTVAISDKGPGIPEAQLRTLFLPFQTTKREGLGIGLYQCKRMIEANGGTILVQSRPGEGTTVRIQLPVVQEPGIGPGVHGEMVESPDRQCEVATILHGGG